jgi:general secretion pathway protein E
LILLTGPTGSGKTTAIYSALYIKADYIFRAAVMDKMPTRALQDIAISQGMQTMWQRGLRRALAGETTLEEIQRVISVDEI